jgi:hypothetical protein
MPAPIGGNNESRCYENGGDNCNGIQVMEEQHKLDSSLPKQPSILQDGKRPDEFASALCSRFGIPECDFRGWPSTYLR